MSDPMDVNKDDLAPEGKAPKADAADTVRDTAPEGEAPTADAAAADTESQGAAGDAGKPSAEDTTAAAAAGNGVTVDKPAAEASETTAAADAPAPAPAPAPADATATATATAIAKEVGEEETPESVEAMAAAAIKAAAAAAAAGGGAAKEGNGTATAGAAPTEQPKKKRARRGGWDTPVATPAAAAGAATVVKKGWGDAPAPAAPVVPMTPLQELQRKLAEEQVAAAMGQAPAVTSVSAGAAALGLTMGGMLPGAGAGASKSPAPPSNPRRLYVGSLHYELKESDITAIFANFGPLKLVDMSHDASTGRHKGFCFIEYVDERGADAALRAMNGFELAGRAIKVGRPHNTDSGVSGGIEGMALPAAMQLPGMAAFMAQRSTAAAAAAVPGSGVAAEQLKAAMMAKAPAQTKIYVGNVEPHITTEMIKTVFEPFGMVVGAEMVVDPNNPGHHKGFGFIQYAQETVAKTVIETMSNFELAGRTLRVAWAQDQSKPALSVLPPGLTAAGAAAQAAAQAAKAAASAAGGVAAAQAAARLTAANRLQGLGSSNGAAGLGGAAGGVWVSGGVGQSGWGGGLSAVQLQAQAQAQAQAVAHAQAVAVQQQQQQQQQQRAGRVSRCMCLVNMLRPEDADDEETKKEILEEFGTYGTVLQLHVHKQRASGGTVVAVRVFVVYSNPTETAVAIQKMNGRFFAGRQVQASAYDEGLFAQGSLDS